MNNNNYYFLYTRYIIPEELGKLAKCSEIVGKLTRHIVLKHHRNSSIQERDFLPET